MRRHSIIIGAAAAAVAITAAGIAGAAQAGVGGGDDNETPITGDALRSATDAALEHLGEGTVSETEVGDEDSYYEVEVTLDSGAQVDVQLDRDFAVVGVEVEDRADDD
ncbi:MAG: PepSY domain-containing protein [Ilumatobacter sp.]|nr:PepSY domain-containing protein [Ilumatobacter sp.]